MSKGDNVQIILGVIGPFWAKWGLGRIPQSWSFFCVVNQTTYRQLHNNRFPPNLVTKRISVSSRGIRKGIFKNFQFRSHLPPKSEIETRSNSHLTQSMLQVTWCTAERYCLLHVVVQTPVSFRGRSTFLYDVRLRSYGASKLPNFSDFGLFSHTKSLQCTFRWPAYSPGVTSQNDSNFSVWQSKVQRGAFRHRRFPATSGRGAGDPQTCPNFHLWKMTIPILNATVRRVRSGPKMSENAQF